MFRFSASIDGSGGIVCPALIEAARALSIEDWASFADIFNNLVTGLAVVLGGAWAYFKFVKGRILRPRLTVRIEAQWRAIRAEPVLHVRIWLTNVGATKFALKQFGSGLKISLPAGESIDHQLTWSPIRRSAAETASADASGKPPNTTQPILQFGVFKEQQWFEPGETVYDDLLLNLGTKPDLVRFELTLIGTARGDADDPLDEKRDTEVFARMIVAADSEMPNMVIDYNETTTG